MAKTDKILIQDFYGGIVRDDRSKVRGAASNVEEVDIFENGDFIRATQICTSDALPASSELYAITADNADTVWGYGKETAGSKIRLFKVTTGGVANPGAWATQFTGADATDLAYVPSFLAYHREDAGTNNFLYYLSNASGTVKLRRYDISGDSESENDASASSMTLSGLDGTLDQTFAKDLFGELMIGNGQFIAKIDKDGIFTEKAFTLPNGWEAVDIVAVSDVSLILARNINPNINECKGFWWDLTNTTQVDDSFPVPWGGPQWVINFRERVIMFCAINGRGKFYTLSGAFPGAVPIGFQDIELENVADASATQPISSPKMLSIKENILYFGLNKTDKTGIYGLGQLDNNKPMAVYLAKRFDTSDYSTHSPTALHIQGPNFYTAFDDNGTADASRCESNNSPTRSSNAVYETVVLDGDDQSEDMNVNNVFVTTKPLAASTSVAVAVDPDYSGSYTTITRADGTALNTTSDVIGKFTPTGISNKKSFKIRLSLTSSTTNSPIITSLGAEITKQDAIAGK